MMKVHNFFKTTFLVATIFCCVSFTAQAQEPTWITTVNLSAGATQTDLQFAIDNAVNATPTTICLQNSITTASTVTVPANKIVRIMSISSTVFQIDANGGDFSVLTVEADGNLWIENIKITGANKTSGNGYGGGVYVDNSGGALGIVTLGIKDGAEISDNKAMSGGGIYAYICNIEITGGKINNNTTNQDGGGVRQNVGNFTMSGGEISGNTAKGDGGGYYGIAVIHGSGITISGTALFNGNTAHGNGGGLYTSESIIVVDGVQIIGNTARKRGGGWYNAYSKLNQFKNCIIKNNTALCGGGVYTDTEVQGDYSPFELSSGEISYNTATGGVVVNSWSDLLDALGGITLDDFFALHLGVASVQDMYTEFASIGISNANELMDYYLDFLQTTEKELLHMLEFEYFGINFNCGGGVYVVATTPFIMTGGNIHDNTATGYGGGIFTEDYDYDTPMQAYKNISITNKDWIYDNTAGQGSLAPFKPAGWDTEHHFDISLLTNDQINYHNPITLDTLCFTDSVTLAVTVIDGGENPTYQWFRNGVAVDDSNDSIFKYKAVAGHRDTILCKVYPDIECPEDVYSQIMIVEMLDSLALDQPDNDEVCVGEMVKKITFEGTYDYVKWEVTTGNGLTIGMPANSGTGDISAFTTTNSGIVTITATPVSGKCEGISKTFTITVNPKQKIKATIKVR